MLLTELEVMFKCTPPLPHVRHPPRILTPSLVAIQLAPVRTPRLSGHFRMLVSRLKRDSADGKCAELTCTGTRASNGCAQV